MILTLRIGTNTEEFELDCDIDYTYRAGEAPCYTPGLHATPGCEEEFDINSVDASYLDHTGERVSVDLWPVLASAVGSDDLYDLLVEVIKEEAE